MGGRLGSRLAVLAGAVAVVATGLTGCAEGGSGSAPSDASARPSGGAVSTAPGGDTETGAAGTGMSESCAKRLAEPGDPVPGAVFAECLVSATDLAGTARMTTTYPDSSAGGPVRMRKPFELYLKLSDGRELLIREERGWLKGPGGWTEAKSGGTAQETMADAVVRSYLALTDPRVRKEFFASSDWQPASSSVETVNSRRTIRYTGHPKLGDVAYDDYQIWVDTRFLPMRTVSTVTLLGRTETGRQDYTNWGKPIRLPSDLPR
ncbi:hypothetical protein [Streptomyces sp. NBC_01216]|uniref:hypothetical protein n=1 Tax=unclassified Streptomyces TaxID=2593676 RepID=UPI002E167A2F|nr:hypothetical protein OG393_03690 [Streptomyces sp. NBC_01216]